MPHRKKASNMINLIKKVPEDLSEMYAYGYCMCLATALHRKYGFEIQVALSLENGVEYIDHAWVFDKTDGNIIDIDGRYAPERNGFLNSNNRVIYGLDEFSLLDIISAYTSNTPEEWEQLIMSANSIVDEYFA